MKESGASIVTDGYGHRRLVSPAHRPFVEPKSPDLQKSSAYMVAVRQLHDIAENGAEGVIRHWLQRVLFPDSQISDGFWQSSGSRQCSDGKIYHRQ